MTDRYGSRQLLIPALGDSFLKVRKVEEANDLRNLRKIVL